MTATAVARSPESRRLPWLNRKLFVASVAIAVAVGFLMYSGMQGTMAAYFVTVSELESQQALVDGKRVRVGGNVERGSIQMGGLDDPILFNVTDGISTIPVVYAGVVPDIFSDHTEVVIEGTFHAGGVFEADTLLTKCPSRFEAVEEGT